MEINSLTFGAIDFEPFVGLAYVNLQTDGYTEPGGIAALSSGSDSTDATYSTLGLRAATTFALGSFEATAKGMLGWRHAFGDITPTSAYQFASGSSPFTVGGVPIAEDAALVEVGLDLQLLPLATFGVAYGGQFGDGATDQRFTANLSWKFSNGIAMRSRFRLRSPLSTARYEPSFDSCRWRKGADVPPR